MAQWPGISFSHGFAARGRALAEKRLAHLTELYDSGRWSRYYDEPGFLSDVREAKAAVEAWRQLEPACSPSLPIVSQSGSSLQPLDAIAEDDRLRTTSIFEDVVEEPEADRQSRTFGFFTAEVADELPLETGEALSQSPAEPRAVGIAPPRLQRPRLPPISFSTDSVGAERDLREA